MTQEFDFIGLNTVISEGFKPLSNVTASSARRAGMDAGMHGTTPTNCHHSYFGSDDFRHEWYRGYRLGRKNRELGAID